MSDLPARHYEEAKRCETSVVGAVLQDQMQFENIDSLYGRHFHDHDFGKIFESLRVLHENKVDFRDTRTVISHLKTAGLLDRVTVLDIVKMAAESVSWNATHYTRDVLKLSQTRELYFAFGKAKMELESFDCDCDVVAKKVQSAIENSTRPNETVKDEIEQPFDDFFDDLEDCRKRGVTPGLMTDFRVIDKATGGLSKQSLTLLAARPSVGKSALALNIAEHVASRETGGVLYVSLEMSKFEQFCRLISREVKIPAKFIQAGKYNDEQALRIKAAKDRLKTLRLKIMDSGRLTVSAIRARARQLKAENALSLIIVDYLQLVQGAGSNETERISSVSRDLKLLASELQIPVLALSQLNRKNTDSNERPALECLRGSGSLEQDADKVIFLHQEKPRRRDKTRTLPQETEVIFAKQRNADQGMEKLNFMADECSFECMDARLGHSS